MEESVRPEERSALALAFLGDAVWEMLVRTHVMAQGNLRPQVLHKRCSDLVSARSQSGMARGVLPLLSEEEAAVYRRGRNQKSPTMAKNASMSEYRAATGWETLMGHLYLQGREDRIRELFEAALRVHSGELPAGAAAAEEDTED